MTTVLDLASAAAVRVELARLEQSAASRTGDVGPCCFGDDDEGRAGGPPGGRSLAFLPLHPRHTR